MRSLLRFKILSASSGTFEKPFFSFHRLLETLWKLYLTQETYFGKKVFSHKTLHPLTRSLF